MLARHSIEVSMRASAVACSLPVVLGALAVALLTPSSARGAAYYVGEIGAKSLARGGANVVDPEDPGALWLNPAAVTRASGVQLNIDLNLVWMASAFTRDCGGKAQGCAPLKKVDQRYADGKRRYLVDGKRNDPAGGTDAQSFPAEPESLGAFGTPSYFDGKTAVENQAGVMPIPRAMLTFNSDSFGIDGFAAGLFVYAPNSGDYKFGVDTPTRYTLIDRDLLEVFYGLTLGYRFQNWIGVGVSLQGVSSGLKQQIALTADQYGNEDPRFDIVAELSGTQHLIPSAAFGLWSNPLQPLGIGDLELGVSVQLPRFVKATGPVKIVSVGEGVQELIDADTVDIKAKDATSTAEFTLPPLYRVGVKYGRDDVLGDGEKLFGFDVEAAVVVEQWSVYDHLYLSTKGLTARIGTGDAEELDAVVQPKNWQDAFSVRLGGTAALFDSMLQIHGGAFYESSAIPNETYSIELVDGDKLGLGTGITGKLWGAALTIGYSHVFVADRVVGQESIVFNGNSGESIFGGETRTRVAMGKYSAGFDMLNVSLNVGFDEMFGFGVYRRPAEVEHIDSPPPAPAPQ
jgi:long-subunit fatty acid transport protein